jgi:hypothetical protein
MNDNFTLRMHSVQLVRVAQKPFGSLRGEMQGWREKFKPECKELKNWLHFANAHVSWRCTFAHSQMIFTTKRSWQRLFHFYAVSWQA